MTHRVAYRMDDNGWWYVEALDVPGAHSHGQTIARAGANIREAIAGMLDLPEGAEADLELEERYDLPSALETALTDVRACRAYLDQVRASLGASTESALEMIEKFYPDMGLRDRAALLGVSFQRVAQLRPGGTTPSGRKRAPSSK